MPPLPLSISEAFACSKLKVGIAADTDGCRRKPKKAYFGGMLSMKTVAAFVAHLTTRSRFQRNVLHLLSANVIAQACLLLATPILTRLFSPHEFGVTSIFIIWSGLFSAMASWRFEWSIPSARSEEEARILTALSLLLAATVTLLLQLVFAAVDQERLFRLIGMRPIPFAALLPLFVFTSSMIAVLSAAYVRAGTMADVARSKYVYSGTQLVIWLLMGFVGMDALGLILGYALAATAGALIMLRNFPFQIRPRLANIAELIHVGRFYSSEASISTAVSLVQFAFAQCLPLLLLFGYSVHEVGIYFVAMRLAGGPIGLLTGGLSSSFWGEAAALAPADPARLRRLFLNMTTKLALLFIPIGIGCLVAPFFLPALLGAKEWSEVGIVLAACIPQVAGMFIFSSTNHLIVYGRLSYQLISDLLSIAGSVVVLLLAKAWELPFVAAVFGISCVVLIAYLLRFALHLKANGEAVRIFNQR